MAPRIAPTLKSKRMRMTDELDGDGDVDTTRPTSTLSRLKHDAEFLLARPTAKPSSLISPARLFIVLFRYQHHENNRLLSVSPSLKCANLQVKQLSSRSVP